MLKQSKAYLQHWIVSLAREFKEDDEYWEFFGDPNFPIPEPMTFKLWSCAICAELKNLIIQGTFSTVNSGKEDRIIPTILVLKIKSTSEGNWDRAKACICICYYVQNIEKQEST